MTSSDFSTRKLTLGPVLFNWAAERKRDFYFRIADEAPVDVVYVGEAVCSKRSPFFDPYLPEICDRLERAGKEVIHSTLALIMTEREMGQVRELAGIEQFPVEANDISAAALIKGRPHVIGPFVNVYNEGTLDYLVSNGAFRVVLPGELPGKTIGALAASGENVELEVQVFGRLPLALSSRCYHARFHKLHKDGCQYVCARDDDGLGINTLTGEPFLAINGTQTLSNTVCNLVQELTPLLDHGVRLFRLWPQSCDMVKVARIFREVLDERRDSQAALKQLAELVDLAPFSNGFHHGREGWRFIEQSATV
ncbi:MAG: U32 family peptidase [Sphingomonadales bacterium]